MPTANNILLAIVIVLPSKLVAGAEKYKTLQQFLSFLHTLSFQHKSTSLFASSNMTTKPGVVLVHGAWHTPWHFANVKAELESKGYIVEAPALPSVGLKRVENSMAESIAAVRALADPRYQHELTLLPPSGEASHLQRNELKTECSCDQPLYGRRCGK